MRPAKKTARRAAGELWGSAVGADRRRRLGADRAATERPTGRGIRSRPAAASVRLIGELSSKERWALSGLNGLRSGPATGVQIAWLRNLDEEPSCTTLQG
jgi:hypothetical protein